MSSTEIQQILAAHPGPWRKQNVAAVRNGMAEITVFDRNNQPVQLFTLLNLAILVSQHSANNAAAQQAKQ